MERSEVLEVLNKVYDPDYLDRSVVDMGLVSENDITVKNNEIEVAYGLTAPLCPFSAAIGLMMKYALEKKLGTAVRVRLKGEHRQSALVAELLESPEQCQELMGKLEEFGILQRCVRL